MTKQDRFLNFDGLRGIAVILVVLFHYAYRYNSSEILSLYPLLNLFKYGYVGVQLFFIISGFVIAFTLCKYKNIFRFTIARFSRLYPIYWIAIAFIFITKSFILGEHIPTVTYLVNLSMLQSFFKVQSVNGVFWTLAKELTFYVFAATLYKLDIFNKNWPYVIWGVVSITWMSLYNLGYAPHHSMAFKIGILLLCRYSLLFIAGIYIYRIAFKINNIRNNIFFAGAILVIYIMQYSLENENLHLVKSSAQIMLCAVCFLPFFAICYKNNSFLENKFLLLSGRISYSWYLTHSPLRDIIFPAIYDKISMYWSVALTFALSFLFALLFYYLIERYIHKYTLMCLLKIYNKISESRRLC